MLCHEGKLSLYCFCGTAGVVLALCMPHFLLEIVPNVWGAALWGPFLYYALINMILRFALKNNDYQIAIRASLLGFVSSVSTLLVIFAPGSWKQFGIYGFFLSFFHYSEFLAIAWSNPTSLSVDSFILNHSVHYAVAASMSWAEFVLETLFLPDFKSTYSVWLVGVALCLFGEIMRKTAMITAMSNFNHLVQYVKAKDHQLITHGVYAYCRHPSYVGWFWWSIGTQIILLNPICICLYTIVSWKFFKDRIFVEEITLLNFFGVQYYEYQQKVPAGLPFIKGYEINKTQ